MFFINSGDAHDAELRFSERSVDSSVVGSVLPASCESGVSVGTTHNHPAPYGCPTSCINSGSGCSAQAPAPGNTFSQPLTRGGRTLEQNEI